MMLKFTSEGPSVTPRPRNRKRVLAAARRVVLAALKRRSSLLIAAYLPERPLRRQILPSISPGAIG